MYLWIVNYSGKLLVTNAKINQKTKSLWPIMFISWKDYYLPAISTEWLINIILYSRNFFFLYSLPNDFPEAAKTAAVGYFTSIGDSHVDALVVVLKLLE